jgi:hypothetical protein
LSRLLVRHSGRPLDLDSLRGDSLLGTDVHKEVPNQTAKIRLVFGFVVGIAKCLRKSLVVCRQNSESISAFFRRQLGEVGLSQDVHSVLVGQRANVQSPSGGCKTEPHDQHHQYFGPKHFPKRSSFFRVAIFFKNSKSGVSRNPRSEVEKKTYQRENNRFRFFKNALPLL